MVVATIFWRRLTTLLVIVPLALSLACLSGKDDGIVRELTDDDARAIALRVDDLPPGFSLTEERLTGNEEFAKNFTSPDEIRGRLEQWGRQRGFAAEFIAESVDRPRQPLMVHSSVDRYADAIRAREAWKGQPGLLANRIAQPSSPLIVPSPSMLGKRARTTRMYVTDEKGRELVVYQVVLQKGTVVVDVSTFAQKHKDDRGEHAFRLARLMAERVTARTK